MQVDLAQEGPFLFTGDQFHVKENYIKEIPQGESMLSTFSSSRPMLIANQRLTEWLRLPWAGQERMAAIYQVHFSARKGHWSEGGFWS